jgi:hypothetical protein
MRYRLYLFSLLIHCQFAYAQSTRIEVKLSRLPKDVEIISLQKEGFLLKYAGGEKRGHSFNSYNLTKLNSNFEEVWNKLLDIPSRFSIEYQLVDSISNQFVWISKSATQIRIDLLNLDSGKNSTQTYGLSRNFKQIISAVLLDSNLFILSQYGPDEQIEGCYYSCCFPISLPLRNNGLSIFKYGNIYTKIDLKNQLKYDRIDISNGISIPDKIQADYSNKKGFTSSGFKYKTHNHGISILEIKNLNQQLQTTDSFDIEAPKNTYLQNIQWHESSIEKVGFGTFNKQAPLVTDNLNTNEAQGFYTVILDSTQKINHLKLFKLSDLSSFNGLLEFSNNYKSLSNSRREKLKRQYQNYSTLIRVNALIERESDFIATAEAFYAVYSTYRDANGNLVQYFEGYNYTHCFILCFDKKGNLKWDKTIPLNFNRLYLNLNQKVKSLTSYNKVQLSYGSGSNINIISIDGDSLSGPKNYELPRLVKEDEKVNEYFVDVTPWHKNKYLIWGVQKIKKSDAKEREGNTIIYIDELTTD